MVPLDSWWLERLAYPPGMRVPCHRDLERAFRGFVLAGVLERSNVERLASMLLKTST
jgi:hypothetical protein